MLGGKGTKCYIIGTPVVHNDRVFLATGQDPEHGEGVGNLHCIDATKRGDITQSGKVWNVTGEDFHRTLGTCAVKDGLVYAADLSGFMYCFDEKTGKRHWRYDTQAALWGSPYVVDGKIYLGDEDGVVHVLKEGEDMKILAKNDMGSSVYTTPVASNGVLFVNNRRMLFAIKAGAETKPTAPTKKD